MPYIKQHDLWHYSIELYQEKSIKDACLKLQDHYDLNVNILLFCCWYAATSRGSLSFRDIEKILTAIDSWHQLITNNLRQLRRQLCKNKFLMQTLKNEVLQHEIYSEHIEQEIITSAMPGIILKRRTKKQKAKDAIQNLYGYCSAAKITLDHQGYQFTKILLSKSFPNISANDFPQLELPF